MLDKGTFRAQSNPFADIPEPDWGAAQTFFNSIGPSFQMSLSGTGVRAGMYFLADALDGDAISKEEFDLQYSYPGGPQWAEGMTRSRAELMLKNYFDDVMAASEVSSMRHSTAAMAGGFVGQALDPVNYVGPALISAGTRLAGSASRVGAAVGQATRTLGEAINPGTALFNADARILTLGQQARLRLAETAFNGTAEALWQVGGINAFTEYTQQQYDSKDLIADLIGAPVIATAFGVGRAGWNRLRPETRAIISDLAARQSVNGESSATAFKAAMAADPEGQKILADKEARRREVTGSGLSRQQMDALAREATSEGRAMLLPDANELFMARPGDGIPTGDPLESARNTLLTPESIDRINVADEGGRPSERARVRLLELSQAFERLKSWYEQNLQDHAFLLIDNPHSSDGRWSLTAEQAALQKRHDQVGELISSVEEKLQSKLDDFEIVSGEHRNNLASDGGQFMARDPLQTAKVKQGLERARLQLEREQAQFNSLRAKIRQEATARQVGPDRRPDSPDVPALTPEEKAQLAAQQKVLREARKAYSEIREASLREKETAAATKGVFTRAGLLVRKRIEAVMRRRKQIDRMSEPNMLRSELLKTKSKNAARKRAEGSLTADEAWISDLYSKAFGIELRFFDEDVSRQTGALGFISTDDVKTLYVRSGQLFGSAPDTMMAIAGHEFSHSISRTNPVTWLAMSDAIVASGANPVVRDAYARTRAALEVKDAPSLWSAMSPGQKIDEVFATVAGRATQTPEFWRSLWSNAPADARIVQAALRERAEAFKARALDKNAPKSLHTLLDELGKAVALAADEGEKYTSKQAKELIYTTSPDGPRYGARHWDFLMQVNSRVLKGEYQAIFGKGWDNSLAAMDRKFGELVEFVERSEDRSGTPARDGQYDIRPWSFTVDKSNPNWKTVVAYRIIQQVFAKADPDSIEGRIYAEWKGKTKEGTSADTLQVSSKQLKEYLGRTDRNGLLRVIEDEDGKFRVGILRDDERVKVLSSPDSDKAMQQALRSKALNGFEDSIRTVADSLSEILWAIRNEPGSISPDTLRKLVERTEAGLLDEVEGRAALEDSMLREFFYSDLGMDVWREWKRQQQFIGPERPVPASTKPGQRVAARASTDNIFDAFLSAFHEFATEKANDMLMRSEVADFRAIKDLIDGIEILQQHRETPAAWDAVLKKWEDTPKLQARLRELVKKARKESNEAWSTFRKNNTKEDRKLLSRGWDQLAYDNSPEFFWELVGKHRAEITYEMKEGVVMRWLATQSDDTDLAAAVPTAKTIDEIWAQIVKEKPEVQQLLERMVEDRLQEFLPGLDRVESLRENKLLNKDAESYEVREWKMGEAEDPDPLLQRADADDTPSTVIGGEESSFMARLADETPERAAQRAASETASEAQRAQLNIKQLAKLSAESLQRDRELFSGWNTNYRQYAYGRITHLMDRMGVPDFNIKLGSKVLSEKFRKGMAEGTLKVSDSVLELTNDLLDIVGNHDTMLAHLNQAAAKGGPGTLPSGYVRSQLERNLRRLDGKLDQALQATEDDIVRHATSQMITMIRDHQGVTNLMSLVRQGASHVKNFLDGLAYKGTRQRTDSVAMHRIVAREKAQSHLVSLLEEIESEIPGFREQWINNQHTRNLELHRHGMYTGGDHVKKVYDRILQRMDEVNEALVGEANSFGANIRLLPGYLWGQLHKAVHFREHGVDTFVRDISRMIDEPKMRKFHGDDWSVQEWAKAFYNEVTDPLADLRHDFDPDQWGNNLADPKGQHRVIFFKPGMAFDYDMKYGSRHTSSLILSQIGSRAEKIGIMSQMGTNYNQVWGKFVSTLGGTGPTFHDLHVADLTFRQISGQLDHPYDAKLAAYGRAVRNWMNAAVGWMSGIASLPDMGNTASQLRFMGGPDALRYRSVLSSMMNTGTNAKERAEWMRGNGVGLQTLVQAYSRILDADGWFINTAEKLSNLTFKYNGLEVMNRATQGAYFDIATQILGDNAKAQTPEFQHWLKVSGISDAEWKQMAQHARIVDGLENVRLSPEMVPDTLLSRKLHMAMRAGMDYALMQPSSSTEALLRMGTRSGTWTGEAVRTITQFKSYPVDMVRRIVRRFNNGWSRNALMERVVWGSTMIGLSVTALSLKDMARGNEPLNPFDSDQWNWHNIIRVAEQSTVGPFAMMGQFSTLQQAAGPAIGSALDIVTSDTAYGRTSAVFDMTPGATAWVWPRRTLMGMVMPETFGEPIQNMYDWRRMQTGQGRLLQSD